MYAHSGTAEDTRAIFAGGLDDIGFEWRVDHVHDPVPRPQLFHGNWNSWNAEHADRGRVHHTRHRWQCGYDIGGRAAAWPFELSDKTADQIVRARPILVVHQQTFRTKIEQSKGRRSSRASRT